MQGDCVSSPNYGYFQMKPYPWIIAHDGTQGDKSYMLECKRCGHTQKFEPPLSITYYLEVAKAFERMHKNCKEKS